MTTSKTISRRIRMWRKSLKPTRKMARITLSLK